jgi:hypothetical protein
MRYRCVKHLASTKLKLPVDVVVRCSLSPAFMVMRSRLADYLV